LQTVSPVDVTQKQTNHSGQARTSLPGCKLVFSREFHQLTGRCTTRLWMVSRNTLLAGPRRVTSCLPRNFIPPNIPRPANSTSKWSLQRPMKLINRTWKVVPKQDHLVCFLGGSFLLGVTEGNRKEVDWKKLDTRDKVDMIVGKGIIEGCMRTYLDTPT
jgi:hypothetical protein